MNKIIHLLIVSGDNYDQVFPLVLHGLQEGVNCFLAKVICSAVGKGICLIDEKDPAQSAFYHFLGLYCGLPHVSGDKAASVGLHKMAL